MTAALSVAPAPPEPTRMTSPSGVTYELLLVTPAMAEAWLGKNVGNRRIRKSMVSRYARDVVAGHWRENGSTVVIGKNGNLLDGQHRLRAVVESESPILTLVVRGVDGEAQPTIDDGAKRTTADRLTFRDEPNAYLTASILRRIMLWERKIWHNTGAVVFSSQEQLEFLDEHENVRAAVAAAGHYRKRKLLPPSIIGLCWYVFSQLDADATVEFFDRLDDGANLAYNHPVSVLRNKLIDLTREPGRVPEDLLLHYVLKTWNLYRAKKEATVLRIGASEKLPTPR